MLPLTAYLPLHLTTCHTLFLKYDAQLQSHKQRAETYAKDTTAERSRLRNL